jgi:hypothetical protein
MERGFGGLSPRAENSRGLNMVRRSCGAGLAAGLFVVCLTGPVFTARAQVQVAADLTSQRDKQKQIQAQTDQTVRRVGTMLRVLEYYELDKSAQKELLTEVASSLEGLSREQMAEIIARLDAAVKAPTEANADAEQHKAYLRHREVLDGMRKLLLRYDSIRDTQQLAERFEKAAYTEVDLHLQVHQLAWRAEQTFRPQPKLAYAPRVNARDLLSMLQGQIDEQADHAREVGHLFDQLRAMKSQLSADQNARLREFEALDRWRRVPGDLNILLQRLHTRGGLDAMLRDWRFAAELQWGVAGDLQATALLLAPALERLPALRVVRHRVDDALRSQESYLKEAEVVKERDPLNPPKEARVDQPMRNVRVKVRPDLVDNPAARQSQDLSAKQGRLEHDQRGSRRMLSPLAKMLAERFALVETMMRDARRALLDLVPDKALQPQRRAVEELRLIREELDRLIAEAEKQRTDPVAALKSVAEKLDQLIQEQKETQSRTDQAENARRFDNLPKLAPEQQRLAERTDAVKQEPMPAKEETQKALDRAAKAMENASQRLEDRKGKEASLKQQQAVTALEEAKKKVQERIAEIEKRRDDIASLEDAAKKLDELSRKENQVAENAKAMTEKPAPEKNADLARQQAELTPKAQEVAKQVEKAAPDASKKVDEGAKKMESAKSEIEKNKLDPAAKEAKASAEKLDQAMKDIAKALEQKKAQELADQAALNKQSPADAAQQLAKALEQTQQAQQQSEKSIDDLKKVAQNHELAKLQKQIAEKADEMKLQEAGRPADDAAKSLQKGELKEAIPEQTKALEKLRDASAKKGEKDEPAPKAAAGEAKANQPMDEPAGETKASAKKDEAGKSKAGQAPEGEARANAPMKAAEAKAAQPKAESPKPGEAKPVQPPEGQAKAAPPPTEKQAESPQAKAKTGQPMGEPAQAGQAKSGNPNQGDTEPKQGQGQQGEGKEGQGAPQTGDAKSGRPEAMQAKAGQAKAGEAKAGQPSEAQEAKSGPSAVGNAQTPGQLAQAQKQVLDATKALAESQKATQSAMAALAQAQAQAPQGVQQQLKQAAKDLAQASKQLDQGSPNSANQSQGKAASGMEKALQSMNEALAKMGQPGAQPGQMAQASPPPGQGQQPGEGEGQQPGEGQPKGQGQKPGQGRGQKPGTGLEKNENRGTGQRLADGKVSNAPSKMDQFQGEGSFLHLPPRQRELIQQALGQSLPPEYSAMIRQYYINIARGRPAVMPNVPPKQP